MKKFMLMLLSISIWIVALVSCTPSANRQNEVSTTGEVALFAADSSDKYTTDSTDTLLAINSKDIYVSDTVSWTDDAAFKAVTHRLDSIYANVFGWYNRAEHDLTVLHQMPDFDTCYMSADYSVCLRAVKADDDILAEQGEIGFFDSDHWVCGQDFQNLSMDIVSGSLTGPNAYRAQVKIHNCGQVKALDIDLVYEQGRWMIDDFVCDGQSEKACIKVYLQQRNSGS